MHIKRFEAPTMLEAVRRVKEELGPDALVLSTRTRRGGAFGLLGRDVVEVTAALDPDANAAAPPVGERRVDRSWEDLRLSKALIDPIESELRELRETVERLVVDASAQRESAQRGEPVRGAQTREELARMLDAHCLPPRDDDPARITLLVGPPGSGKTTTLAKLAARERRLGSGELSLITTDTHRIGAEEQLRTWSRLLGVPFGVAVSPEDLLARVGEAGRRRVLVDTEGRSRRDPEPVNALRRFRERVSEPVRIHLVLSAMTKDEDLSAEIRRWSVLKPDSLVMTHMDESESVENVANLLLNAGAPPLAWLGTGQRVPDDLTAADPDALAARVLGEAG